MGDSASGPARGAKPGQARSGSHGSSVLTPPAGLPSVPETTIPAQRAAGDLRPSVPPVIVTDPCACGHGRAVHDHYRAGHDCGACGAVGCADFRRMGGPVRRALRRIGLVA